MMTKQELEELHKKLENYLLKQDFASLFKEMSKYPFFKVKGLENYKQEFMQGQASNDKFFAQKLSVFIDDCIYQETETEERYDIFQHEKIAYFKFVHLSDKSKNGDPIYQRYIPRLGKFIDVYDEVQIFRLITYSHPIETLQTRDRSSGTVDILFIHPWRDIQDMDTDPGDIKVENKVIQNIYKDKSNVFCNSANYINGFQKDNTDYATKMEMFTKVARLIVDFSSLSNLEHIFRKQICKGFKKTSDKSTNNISTIPIQVQVPRNGIYCVEGFDLNKDDVIGIEFDLNWDKI